MVELKFFGGFTNQEVADELGVSDGTIEAIWLHARLWLYRALNVRSQPAAPMRPRSVINETVR